ncbi:hypothetical protein EON65_19905 [archaeon]|nr:MAG: hypothetical protein EON65_19905 [archaeon]
MGHIVVVNALDYGVDSAYNQLSKILTNLLKCGMCTVPVLVMVGMHSSDINNSLTVRHIAKSIVEPNLTNCPWYVQPYNAIANVGGLREGYLAGINWLLRNILLQKSVAY